jgi:hypothetical protein
MSAVRRKKVPKRDKTTTEDYHQPALIWGLERSHQNRGVPFEDLFLIVAVREPESNLESERK